MKWQLRAFSTLLLSLLLSACATPSSNEKTSFFADIPAGSILKIKRSLTIPANQARVSLQFSNQVSLSQLDMWEPHCQLIMRTISRKSRQIPQGDFHITRVTRDEEPFSGGVSYTWTIKTYLYLESNDYNDIYRLVCGQVWDGATSRRLYMSEFEEAVGDYISIEAATVH